MDVFGVGELAGLAGDASRNFSGEGTVSDAGM